MFVYQSFGNLTAENIPLLEWSQSTFSNALVQGDSLYMKALSSDLTVPVMVANNELPVTVANNELSSTTVNNKKLGYNNKKQLQGLVITHHAIESHYYDFHTALSNTFLSNNYAILILGYVMALVKQNNVFYLFDSHARDLNGMPNPNGTAVVMKFTSIVDMEQHLSSLSITLHVNLFELVPVQLSIICTFDPKKKYVKTCDYQKKSRSVQTSNERQIRHKKAHEYKKTKK